MGIASSLLRVGGALLDPERGRLRRSDGVETVLRPKTLDLLMLLLRMPGRLVTRAEILDTVWPEVHVTDDSITQCVVEIRRALGTDAALLKTVPRRGYLLEPHAGFATAPAFVPPTTPPTPAVPVVAVMPFRVVPPDPALAVFADGVLEGVVGALATLREPVVISANSTLRLGGAEADPLAVGTRLGAGYVASGSVRGAGGRIRVGVALTDARSAAVLWHRCYEVSHGEEFETQDRIAAIIANTLAPRVQEMELARSQRQRPSDMGAYQMLLQARRLIFRMERPAFDEAGMLLRRAAALDPDFPAIQSAIADWHSLRLGQGWSIDRAADMAALEAAVEATLALDANNPHALALLGHNQAILRRRYDDAIALFDRALAAAPNDAETWMWTSPTYAWMGEGEEALRRAERAIGLSPEDPLIFRYEHFLSIAHYTSEHHEEAVDWGMRSLRSNPNYTSNLRVTAAALAALGRQAEAKPLVRRVMELEPGFRVGPMIERQPFRDDAARERYGQRLVEAGLPA